MTPADMLEAGAAPSGPWVVRWFDTDEDEPHDSYQCPNMTWSKSLDSAQMFATAEDAAKRLAEVHEAWDGFDYDIAVFSVVDLATSNVEAAAAWRAQNVGREER